MKAIRVILFAGLLGGLATVPALAQHHMVGGCNDCRDDCRSGHRLFGHRRDCGPCEDKVCVPKTEKVKSTRAIYECKCVDFCLPGHPGRCFTPLSHGCKDNCAGCGQPAGCGHAAGCCHADKGCDDGCADGKCEHKVRTRKVLIKRFKTEERDVVRCVPETRPCVITQDCGPAGKACDTTIIIHEGAKSGQPTELAPMPIEKKK